MGVSRRIRNIPREFEPGKTWVAVAHIEAIPVVGAHELNILSLHDAQAECSCGQWSLSHTGEMTETQVKKAFAKHLRGKPGIFQVFRPSHVEYVVRGDETEEDLEALRERGIVLVDVIPEGKEEVFPEEVKEIQALA